MKLKYPEMGGESGYQLIQPPAKKFGNSAKPYWVLMTEPLEEKRGYSIEKQEKFIIDKGEGKYRTSKTLEVVLSAFIEHALGKKRLYQFNPLSTSILCSDLITTDTGIKLNVVVGGFNGPGLHVNQNSSPFNMNYCVVGVREEGLSA